MDSPLETVRETARLACLELSPAEEADAAKAFERILRAFEELATVDVEGVREMHGPIESDDVLREDRDRPSLGTEAVLERAPAREGPFFRVPKTVGDGT